MPHSSLSPSQKSFPQQATMGIKPSVAEVGKQVSCPARLCRLFLMTKIFCTINGKQALSKSLVILEIWK